MPTHYQGAPETVRALDTFIKLTRATESLLARLNRQGTIRPLSPSQFAVLEALYYLGPMLQGQVSAKVLKSTGNITLVVDNLEKQGLVQCTRESQDRRQVTIHLTEAGKEMLERIFPDHARAICDEINVLTPEEQVTLAALCLKLGKPPTLDRGRRTS
jgi:MarR family transcriptional regulator, 2-MHQ and catechol-resistance regulon repressor